MSDLLQSALANVGLALGRLRTVTTPDQAVLFFRQIGYEVPAGAFGPALSALATEAEGLIDSVQHLADASDEASVITAVAGLLTKLAGATDAIGQLHAEIKTGGGAALPNIEDLPRRLTDFLLLDFLDRQRPDTHETLHLLGLIEHEPNPSPGESTRLINWDRFGTFLTSPMQIANDVYRWETDFDVEKFLTRMESMMRAASLPGGIYPQSAAAQAAVGNAAAGLPELRFPIFQKGLAPGTYSQFGITFSPVEAQGSAKKGLALLPYLMGATEFNFDVCDRGELVFESSADIRGIGIVIRPPLDAQGLLNLTGAFRASVTIREKADKAEQMILVGTAGGTRLSIQGLGIKWFAERGPEQLDLGFEAEVQKLRLVIAPGEGDGFLQEILSGLNVQAEAGFAFGMTLLSGFTFKGGAKFAVEFATHVELGPVNIEGLRLSLAPANDHIALEAGAVLRFNLGPVTAVVENVGLRSEVRFRPGNLGPADLDITFRPPSGLGLAIDAPTVCGGGFLRFDPEKGEYSGILQLEVAETIAVKAVGLLTTKMPDGSKGFSLVVIVTAEGFAPIQLGMGFTLTGIGGLLGINRTVSVDVLRGGLKNGTLGSIMFPSDPIRNAPQIVSDLRTGFPPVRGRHVFGPMATICWGTPTILTLELALILELPEPVRLIILGRLKAILPDERAALVQVRMDAVGVIDFNKGEVSLDATLYDSRILEFALTGDMALRASWGAQSSFLLAVGGFNPRFLPPAGFPKLNRVALNLSQGDDLRLQCAAYLALTSNTAQFGARITLHAAGGGFTVDGYLGVDALFQFTPFSFVVDISAGVALRYHGHLLMGISLDGTLSGPTPWHVKGKASFDLLFFSVSVSVDHRFGRDEPAELPAAVDVLGLLIAAVNDARNWSSELPRGEHPLVTFREPTDTTTLRAHPLAVLTVRQRVVPLNMTIDTFGNAPVSGTNRFTLEPRRADGSAGELPLSFNVTQDSFGVAQFLRLSDDERLSRPSFESKDAGLRFGSDEVDYHYDPLLDADVEYETQMVVPGQEEEPPSLPVYVMRGAILDAVVINGAAGQAPLRRTGNARYRTIALAT